MKQIEIENKKDEIETRITNAYNELLKADDLFCDLSNNGVKDDNHELQNKSNRLYTAIEIIREILE